MSKIPSFLCKYLSPKYFWCFTPTTGGTFACKSIDKTLLTDSTNHEYLEKEPKTMILLSSHPNIINLYDFYEDDRNLFMVIDLCESEDLYQILSRSLLTEIEAASIMIPLLELILHCHKRGVCLRELKPENILFDERNKLKLVDFGSDEWFGEERSMEGVVGTLYYVAPEVLEGKVYNEKIDVWSASVILYIMLAGVPPFYGESAVEIFEAVLRGNLRFPTKIFWSVSSVVKDLLRKMICRHV